MTARSVELKMLDRCVAAAKGASSEAQNQQEANVFRLAAMVLGHRFPVECGNLMAVSNHYFALHPGEQLPPAEVVNKGWVFGLSRLRDMLSKKLCGSV